MESGIGFGENLEGFLIKGNLSVLSSESPTYGGDGSLEAPGTLYVNKIRKYDSSNDNSITINNVELKETYVYIPHTIPSTDTAGSLILNGGITIKETQDCVNLNYGGGLTVLGGVAIKKKLRVGGGLDVNDYKITSVADPDNDTDAANKRYVKTYADSVAGKVSGDFLTDQIILGASDGTSIRGRETLTYSYNPVIPSSSTLNLGDGRITNLGAPIDSKDAATKEYVDSLAGTLDGDFTTGQVIIGASEGDALRGYNTLTFNGETLSINSTIETTGLSNGGALVSEGGAVFKKDAHIVGVLSVGSDMDANDYKITNLSLPIDPSDGANKEYVDSVAGRVSGGFLSGQIILGGSDGDQIIGHDTLTYIYDSTNPTASTLNLGDGRITNLGAPIDSKDAATKAYVDSLAGTLEGNFTTGQVIIGASEGDALRGYNTLTFDGSTLSINSTIETTDLSVGGALISEGGVVIKKDAHIVGVLSVGSDIDANDYKITNLQEPTDLSDAATKFYVDSKTYGNLLGDFGQNQLIFGSTDGSSVTSYPALYYKDPTLVISTTENATGIGSGGSLTIDGGTSVGKDLYVGGTLDMTNGKIKNVESPTAPKEAANKAYVDAIFRDCCSGDETEITIPLNTSVFEPIDISELIYDYYVDAFVSYIYFLHSDNENGNLHTFFKIHGLNNDGVWQIHTSFIGDIPNFDFYIRTTEEGAGVIQYTNYNTTGETSIKVSTYKGPNYVEIKQSDYVITLLPNQTVPVVVDEMNLDFGERENFRVYLYVTIEELELSTLFFVQALRCHDATWKANVSYVGDNTDIDFYISEMGILTYTNLHNYEAKCKFTADTFNQPLPVPNGGTGRVSFNKNAVLRGNLTAPVVATDDFVYDNYKLRLGPVSSILLTNTSVATSATTGGTFVSYGGIGVARNVVVGQALNVRSVDITPNVGDIVAEREFSADNNINTPQDIIGFDLSNVGIKSFTGVVCVTVMISDLNTTQYDTLYEMKALRKKSGWVLYQSFEGDDTGIQFSITGTGQIRYISPDFGLEWEGTIMKFRGLTTSMPS